MIYHTHTVTTLYSNPALPYLLLHLLHLDRVRLSSAHVQLMVAHAQGQNALVDAQTRSVEDEVLQGKYEGYGRKIRRITVADVIIRYIIFSISHKETLSNTLGIQTL